MPTDEPSRERLFVQGLAAIQEECRIHQEEYVKEQLKNGIDPNDPEQIGRREEAMADAARQAAMENASLSSSPSAVSVLAMAMAEDVAREAAKAEETAKAATEVQALGVSSSSSLATATDSPQAPGRSFSPSPAMAIEPPQDGSPSEHHNRNLPEHNRDLPEHHPHHSPSLLQPPQQEAKAADAQPSTLPHYDQIERERAECERILAEVQAKAEAGLSKLADKIEGLRYDPNSVAERGFQEWSKMTTESFKPVSSAGEMGEGGGVLRKSR